MNKTISYLAVIILVMIGYYTTEAQTSDQAIHRKTLQTLFNFIDQGDLDAAGELLRDDAVIFDSVHMLRFDGKTDYLDYLSSNSTREDEDTRTFIRQPVTQTIGQVGVMNFYYSRTYFSPQDTNNTLDEEDEMSEDMAAWGDEIGRGTAVFTRGQGRWKVVSLHLSEITTGAYE